MTRKDNRVVLPRTSTLSGSAGLCNGGVSDFCPCMLVGLVDPRRIPVGRGVLGLGHGSCHVFHSRIWHSRPQPDIRKVRCITGVPAKLCNKLPRHDSYKKHLAQPYW